MATAKEAVDLAGSQVGIVESPAGSNCVKYNDWFYDRKVSGSDYPWCMAFVQWVLTKCGVDVLKTAGCTTFLEWAKQTGRFVTSGYRPGDVMLYTFKNKFYDADHCGIMKSKTDDGIIAVEGNTAVGNDDNGGAVMLRSRRYEVIIGAYRPAYEGEAKTVNVTLNMLEKSSKGVQVKTVQRCLNMLGYTDGNNKKLVVDADYGAKTIAAVKKFQKKRKIDVDGIFGSDSWNELLRGEH